MNDNPQEQASKLENPDDITTPHIAQVIERVVDFSFKTAPVTSKLNILELGLSGFSQSKSLTRFTKSLTSVDQSDQKIKIASQSQVHNSLLCSDLLSFLQTTDESDLVLDPFCGSGTTGVESNSIGRRFVGGGCYKNSVIPNESPIKPKPHANIHNVSKADEIISRLFPCLYPM